MKVFLDSNVLVSAFATRGLSADLFRLVIAEHELVTAEVVLEEVERVLAGKFRIPSDDVAEILSLLREYHVEPKPPSPASVPISDPDDAWVLASARAAGADVLATGDAAFLAVSSEVPELQITNPRGFWELHRGPHR
jgi:uncharacterized protein